MAWDNGLFRKPLVEGQPVGSSKRKLRFYPDARNLLEYCGKGPAVVVIKLQCNGHLCGACWFLIDDNQHLGCVLFPTQSGTPRCLKRNPHGEGTLRLEMCQLREIIEQEV
jgi:hypothetical protein